MSDIKELNPASIIVKKNQLTVELERLNRKLEDIRAQYAEVNAQIVSTRTQLYIIKQCHGSSAYTFTPSKGSNRRNRRRNQRL